MSCFKAGSSWDVLIYEADMMGSLCTLLIEGNQNYASFPQHVQNAIVESALLHTRQLADILLSRGTHCTDIRLDSMLPTFTPSRLSELESVYGNRKSSGSPCEILNTRMAHATTLRRSSHDYSSILNQLSPLLLDIVKDVFDERDRRMDESKIKPDVEF